MLSFSHTHISQVISLESEYQPIWASTFISITAPVPIVDTRLDTGELWLSSRLLHNVCVLITLRICLMRCSVRLSWKNLLSTLEIVVFLAGCCLHPSPSKRSLTSLPNLSSSKEPQLIYNIVDAFLAFVQISGNGLRLLCIMARMARIYPSHRCIFIHKTIRSLTMIITKEEYSMINIHQRRRTIDR